jgi:signal transduction histidine kinase
MLAAKDEAEKANQTKSNFLSHLSHDLRTPVNSMIGFTDILLSDTALTEKAQTDYLTRIKKNGAYMQVLINDLLDLSRIEAGKLNLYPVKIPLTAFLMEIVMLIQMDLQRKSFQFIYQFDDNLPGFVVTDETRLRQILVNLLGNAIKFTPQGSVTFRVKRIAEEPPAPIVRFEIIDTGVGISEADLERVFEPFEQTGSEEQRGKGTGLGLAISRHLVALLGGQLQATSQVGKGSRFWFDLPFSLE